MKWKTERRDGCFLRGERRFFRKLGTDLLTRPHRPGIGLRFGLSSQAHTRNALKPVLYSTAGLGSRANATNTQFRRRHLDYALIGLILGLFLCPAEASGANYAN